MEGMTFQVNARHNGISSWIEKGDAVSIEFPDGKGVSARLADVLIAPGGSPFFLVCNETGEWPDLSPLRDMIAMVQSHGYVVQEAEDYAAGLRIEYERGMKDARRQQSGYTAAQGKRIGVEEGANKIEFHDDGGASMIGTFRTHTTSPQLRQEPEEVGEGGYLPAERIADLTARLAASEEQRERQRETIVRQQDVERALRRQLSAAHTVITQQGDKIREKEELETSLRNDLGELRNKLEQFREGSSRLTAGTLRTGSFEKNGPLLGSTDVVNAQELHVTLTDGATLTVNLSR